MQEAAAVAPLRHERPYYVPDIFRSQVMTLCVANAVWDDALQELNQDQSAPLVSLSPPYISADPMTNGADVVVTVRYAGWLGLKTSDTLIIPVTLPQYRSQHETPGFPGPVACSGS
jgi:hypothetical protein